MENQILTSELRQLYLVLGGIRVASKISEAIASQAISALEQVQEQKLFIAEGFSNFAEFLDNSPSSPMSKSKYYELKKIHDALGADEFDLLHSINVPVAQRKLLTSGDISIEGEMVIVGDKQYQINDKKAVKKAITRLIELQNILEADSAKQAKAIEKNEKRITELEEKKATVIADPEINLARQAILTIAGGFNQLQVAVHELSAAQFATFKKKQMREVDHLVQSFAEFMNSHKPTGKGVAAADDVDVSDAELEAIFSDED